MKLINISQSIIILPWAQREFPLLSNFIKLTTLISSQLLKIQLLCFEVLKFPLKDHFDHTYSHSILKASLNTDKIK